MKNLIKYNIVLGLFVGTLIIPKNASSSFEPRFCLMPVHAVLQTLECIEIEDAQCAGEGYHPNFRKLHNGQDTNTVISGPEFWEGAFTLLDIELDIDHIHRIGLNQISLRYVEKVTLITGEIFFQHEHALVTVDNECKMLLWDQFGDNKEQQDVDDKVQEIIDAIN